MGITPEATAAINPALPAMEQQQNPRRQGSYAVWTRPNFGSWDSFSWQLVCCMFLQLPAGRPLLDAMRTFPWFLELEEWKEDTTQAPGSAQQEGWESYINTRDTLDYRQLLAWYHVFLRDALRHSPCQFQFMQSYPFQALLQGGRMADAIQQARVASCQAVQGGKPLIPGRNLTSQAGGQVGGSGPPRDRQASGWQLPDRDTPSRPPPPPGAQATSTPPDVRVLAAGVAMGPGADRLPRLASKPIRKGRSGYSPPPPAGGGASWPASPPRGEESGWQPGARYTSSRPAFHPRGQGNGSQPSARGGPSRSARPDEATTQLCLSSGPVPPHQPMIGKCPRGPPLAPARPATVLRGPTGMRALAGAARLVM
jgi:hypothetical protein